MVKKSTQTVLVWTGEDQYKKIAPCFTQGDFAVHRFKESWFEIYHLPSKNRVLSGIRSEGLAITFCGLLPGATFEQRREWQIEIDRDYEWLGGLTVNGEGSVWRVVDRGGISKAFGLSTEERALWIRRMLVNPPHDRDAVLKPQT